MEYVVVRATHPSWLTLQLPSEVAQLLRYEAPTEGSGEGARSISFLNRGAGIARVVATHSAREALAVETVRQRWLATARPGDRLLFSLPAQVAQHLRLVVTPRANKLRGTDDSVVWFVPASEYYEFRASLEAGKGWSGPKGGGLGHVYLAKSLLPFPREFAQLAETEARIEAEEWAPGVEALLKVGRGRRSVV